MIWIEILQVAGPIALGLAGILSGYGIARHQSGRATEAERRQRTYDAYSQLLGAAVETETFLALYSDEREESAYPASSLEIMRGEASAAIAKCYLVSGGRLAPLAEDLSSTIRTTLAMTTMRADDDAGRKVLLTARWDAIDDLILARQKFAAAARLEIGWRDSKRKHAKHQEYLEQLESLKLLPIPRPDRAEQGRDEENENLAVR